MRAAVLAGCVVALMTTEAPAAAVELEPVGTFSAPMFMTSPSGDPRLFVVERGGRIQLVDDGTTTQFLDISAQTTTDIDRGLLSMAFDPNYASNGLFYVFYTGDGADSGGTLGDGHVDEFQVSSDPDVADPTSRRPILNIARPSSLGNHNGGQLQFGKDGYLYISTGDGGTGGATAPDLTVLNGKMLRVDPHGASPGAYGIPSGNPFATSSFARHEIWAYGFRNPWRFSFDYLTGDMLVGDVGEKNWEEVEFAPASSRFERGVDYGWPNCEGFDVKGTSTPCTVAGVANPGFVYPHADPGGGAAYGCAIIGGYVYRGNQIPELSGRYVYADHCTGQSRSVQLGLPLAGGDRAESAVGVLNQPNSFGEDANCELYVTSGNSVVEKIVGSSPASVAPACQSPPATGSVLSASAETKKRCTPNRHHASTAKRKHCKKRRKTKK